LFGRRHLKLLGKFGFFRDRFLQTRRCIKKSRYGAHKPVTFCHFPGQVTPQHRQRPRPLLL
jgi:hypothetical protein